MLGGCCCFGLFEVWCGERWVVGGNGCLQWCVLFGGGLAEMYVDVLWLR
jgi:hypothetical protein